MADIVLTLVAIILVFNIVFGIFIAVWAFIANRKFKRESEERRERFNKKIEEREREFENSRVNKFFRERNKDND